MKKTFIKTIISSVCVLTILSGNVVAKAEEVNSMNIKNSKEITTPNISEPTEEEIAASEEKIKLAEEYENNKITPFGYGYLVTLPTTKYKTAVQQRWNWCGPAAAYNAMNGKRTQTQYSYDLVTGDNGTNFPGTWKYVLDTDRPGNNYTATWGSGYSYSDWKAKLKNSIIYTIDRGYPVIADTNITSNSSTWLHPGYSYATNTYHYVAVVGYDDQITVPEALIVDSNTASSLPIKYWTTIDKLASATKNLGIMW
ncbi:C39 family peptidase [Clostridium isatidis]|uniref:C39 family peptidase n=1 Tax=Clostridium isatidis TaxID=182773 RepID=UPI003AB0B0DE